MCQNNPLTLLGDMSKPATLLIKKCSNAIGHCVAPWQTQRMAKAEVAADLIRAEGQIAIDDLQRRAVTRFVAEETAKQQNIDDIMAKALPMLEEDSNPEEIEDDWLTFFFNKCRITSNDQMQKAWAKVLAGEANESGSFSKRTLEILSFMSQNDAILFTHLCGFTIIEKNEAFLIVLDKNDEIYVENDIIFSVLAHLKSVGLIHYESISSYTLTETKKITMSYFGRKIIATPIDANNNVPFINLGNVHFTQSGVQLFNICQPSPVPGFVEYFTSKLQRTNKAKITLVE